MSIGRSGREWAAVQPVAFDPGETLAAVAAGHQATPHYCLRQLGLIESSGSKGGRDYQLFRETVRRLPRVIYENTGFYDPIRGEHRDVAFGVLKYSLPIYPASSRTWRFVWDQQFFEFRQATGGSLWFDHDTYRTPDFASRRLFFLLQKVFYRSSVSPTFDVGRMPNGSRSPCRISVGVLIVCRWSTRS